jgi:hypothetical protein
MHAASHAVAEAHLFAADNALHAGLARFFLARMQKRVLGFVAHEPASSFRFRAGEKRESLRKVSLRAVLKRLISHENRPDALHFGCCARREMYPFALRK